MNCPGSVNLAATLPEGATTFAAAEGTHAHAIAAQCLKDGITPDAWLDTTTVVEGHDIVCDAEMVEGIVLYLETVVKLKLESSKGS